MYTAAWSNYIFVAKGKAAPNTFIEAQGGQEVKVLLIHGLDTRWR
jgi:hypothetical protein